MKGLNLLNNNVKVRKAQESDCAQLLVLMKELAVFEGYIDDFIVSVYDLIAHGFSNDQTTTFTAVVAEQDGELIAYVVYYLIPFTYDLKPTLFIKEFFVDSKVRSMGIGGELMEFTIQEAKNKNYG